MTVALTALLGALAVAGLTAVRPVLLPRLSGFEFTLGLAAGELSGQLLCVTAACTAALVGIGWPSDVLGIVAGCVAGVAAASYVALLVVSFRTHLVVLRSLRATAGLEELVVSRRDVWLRWWRSCVALPFGHRNHSVQRDVAYADDGLRAHRLDVYFPRGGAARAPVLLFVHGGAWVFGSKRRQGLPMLHELAARGWVCLTCDYRLSPGATWPDHVVDVKLAVAWARRHAATYGGDPSRFLAIAGNSAGGHLAALAALTPSEAAWQPGFEAADTHVDACVSLYGVLEVTGDPALSGRQGTLTVSLLERTVMKAPFATSPEVYEAASPLHRIHEGAPPFLVLHGTHDTLVAVSVARSFVAAFGRGASAPIAYVELPWAQHAFDLLCSPRCTATTRGIAAFLDAMVAKKAAAPPAMGSVGPPAPP